jgi:multisubunit Na+/H+ antiporter MnhB subunit
MPATPRRTRSPWRSRLWAPAVCLALGVVMFAAFAIGDEPGQGLGALGVMAALAALFALGGRSDTLRGLGGPGRDERWSAIDLRATAFAGFVMAAAVIGGWLVEVAQGRDGAPYAAIAAIGGLAYLAAIAFLRWRG